MPSIVLLYSVADGMPASSGVNINILNVIDVKLITC